MTAIDYARAQHRLSRQDPVLGALIARLGPCRLRRTRTYFIALVEAIVWQQLSWRAACAIHRRMLRAMGKRYPGPRDILAVQASELRSAGLSRRKVEYLTEMSRLVDSGRLSLRRIARAPDEEVVAALTAVRGIGRWSAEMFLIFGLNRPDVFPSGDLGLKKAIAEHYDLREFPSPKQLHRLTEPWRPYRTIATWYLWRSTDGVPGDTPS